MLDRSAAPASEKISNPNLPVPQKQLLSGGIELISLAQHDQPVIMLELALPTSRSVTNPGATINLATKMLLEGTSKRNSSDIAEFLDFHGSHMEVRPGLDYIHIRLYCLKKHFESQVGLISEILTTSVFPEREFEKIKTIRLQQIKQQYAKTNAFASIKFRASIFNNGHPYGYVTTEDAIKNTTLDDIKDFFQHQLKVQPSVYLAGDISEAEILILDRALANIEFAKAEPFISPISNSTAGEKIEWKNSVQSSLRLGKLMITRQDEDIHKLHIANDLLGGFFGSRLMKNIREEKGLTYGIYSSMAHMKDASYWVIGTDVLKEKAELAISEIKKEIDALAVTPPSEDELDTLKSYLKGKWLMSFDNCFNSMQLIMGNHLAGLTPQYWTNFLRELESCTAEDISKMAQKHLSGPLTEVVVG